MDIIKYVFEFIGEIVSKLLGPLALAYFAWITSTTVRLTFFEKVDEKIKKILNSTVTNLEEKNRNIKKAQDIADNVLAGYMFREYRKKIYKLNELDGFEDSRGNNMNRIIAVFIILIIISSFIWFTVENKDTTYSNDEHIIQNVSLTASKNIWSTLPIIARQKGFFEEEGLNVSINYVQVAKFSMDALVAGQSHFSAVVDVNLAYLGYTGNVNVSTVATIVEAYDGAIVARKDKGILSPSDLKGKSIGILQGTTSQIFVDRFLADHDLSANDVKIVNLSPISIQTSISQGEIDAGSLWQPFIYNISRNLGDDIAIVFNDPAAYTGYMNIAIRKDWGEHNKDTVMSFLKALEKAEVYVKNNKDEAQQIISKEIGLDLFVVKNIWGEYKFHLSLDKPVLLDQIVKESKWIKETQKSFHSKELPDLYEQYIDSSFLVQIKN
jgi:ABC-type nitrate/sulfonate/bicarbonate transport system substrate-binding protein